MAGSAIGAVTSIIGGFEQAGAAEDAAGLWGRATQEAVGELRGARDTMRADLAPYRDIGESALKEYGALYGIGPGGPVSPEEQQAARDRFIASPSYQFRMDEGLRALDRSASARGKLLGGGYGRELTRYGQGLASTEFGDYANRLAGLASGGQQAATTTSQIGANYASNIANTLMGGAAGQGNAMMAAGTARASGYVGAGNALSGGVENMMLANMTETQLPFIG